MEAEQPQRERKKEEQHFEKISGKISVELIDFTKMIQSSLICLIGMKRSHSYVFLTGEERGMERREGRSPLPGRTN